MPDIVSSLDWSRESLEECFSWESNGVKPTRPNNGYIVGKQWYDVHVSMWKEDFSQGLMSLEEFDEYQRDYYFK